MFVEGYYADVSFELSTPASYDDPGDGGYVEAGGDSSVSIAKIREKFRLSKSDFDAVMDILKTVLFGFSDHQTDSLYTRLSNSLDYTKHLFLHFSINIYP